MATGVILWLCLIEMYGESILKFEEAIQHGSAFGSDVGGEDRTEFFSNVYALGSYWLGGAVFAVLERGTHAVLVIPVLMISQSHSHPPFFACFICLQIDSWGYSCLPGCVPHLHMYPRTRTSPRSFRCSGPRAWLVSISTSLVSHETPTTPVFCKNLHGPP